MNELNGLPKQIKRIKVFKERDEAGVLTYSANYHYQPLLEKCFISLTMQREDLSGYSSGALHPIFLQNLPEGFNRRFIADKLARYAKVNDMYLLALQGNQGIGCLTYASDLTLPDVAPLSIQEIVKYDQPKALFPELLEKYYLRNALSGVQPKVAIHATSKSETGRTVEQKDIIVKTSDSDFPLLTVNEYVCMEAARFCGLNVPKTYLSDNLEHYIVERFDYDQDGQKLGYEDFVTLLKKPNDPDAKYLGSYETLLKATSVFTKNNEQVETMYKFIVFNCLIGNGDAHLKNFALQYTPDMQNVFVSPLFDVTHTLIYESIDNNMALKLEKSKQFPDKRMLMNLAQHGNYKIKDAGLIIDTLAQGIMDYLERCNELVLFPGLKVSIEQSVSNVMRQQAISAPYRHDKKPKYP